MESEDVNDEINKTDYIQRIQDADLSPSAPRR